MKEVRKKTTRISGAQFVFALIYKTNKRKTKKLMIINYPTGEHVDSENV